MTLLCGVQFRGKAALESSPVESQEMSLLLPAGDCDNTGILPGKLMTDSAPKPSAGAWSRRRLLPGTSPRFQALRGRQVLHINHIVCTETVQAQWGTSVIQGTFIISAGTVQQLWAQVQADLLCFFCVVQFWINFSSEFWSCLSSGC